MTLYSVLLMLSCMSFVHPKILIEDSLLSTMCQSAFLFDKLQSLEAHKSILTHPYLTNGLYLNQSLTLHVNQSETGFMNKSKARNTGQLKFGNIDQSTNEQLQILELLYPESTLLGSKGSIRRKRRNIDVSFLPTLQLVVLLNVPLLEIYEGDWMHLQTFIFEDFDIFTINYIEARNWQENVDPALSTLEELVSMLGMDGEACVLRAVCDIAATPDITPDGLMGDMLRVFFYYLVSSEPAFENELDSQNVPHTSSRGAYYRASQIGRETGLCQEHYPGCPLSLTNLMEGQLG